jgi:cation diffusion facilitator CzcD-associated flavoprotein CzcO
VAARSTTEVHDTLIVGRGFSGIGAAIKLTQAGVDDLIIVERAHRVGGTWRDNTYPGAACDIPSLLYSFSFVPNPTWSRAYSPAEEIQRHIEDMVDQFDLRRRIHFGVEVNGLEFDEELGIWDVRTTGGETYRARTVVLASGPLPDHDWPDIRGLDTYEGTKILVKQADFVKVFQRTPGWVMPRLDLATPTAAQSVFAKVPVVQRIARGALYWGHEASATALVWNSPLTNVVKRISKAHLNRQVRDPWLRRQLTPDFTPGCKRILISNDYYPALQRDNCKLIDWPIATISPVGIRTSDGIEHHLDAIVFATGYDVHLTGPPYPVTGIGGRTMAQDWAGGAQAYKSINAHGYPNLFLMTGPNSGPGHNSLLVFVEGQIDYAVAGITRILRDDLRYLDVREDAQRRHNEVIQRRLTKTTWMSGCSSWYLTPDGFNASMYPGFATQYLRQMRDFRFGDYDAVPRDAVNAAPGGVRARRSGGAVMSSA